jgi:hypothetical protein
VCLIINRLRTTLSSLSLDLIIARIRFLVLIIRFVLVYPSMSRFFMSITMSISSGLFTFFITLLIEVPIEIEGDLGGLD